MELMRKKLIIIVILCLTLILVVYLVWPSDERQIKRLFKEGENAIESENLESVMSRVSFNYLDDYGMTYLYLKEALKRQFEALSDIDVEYENLKIKDLDGRATAEMDLRVIATIGNERGYIICDIKTPLHIKFTLEKERTKWLIVNTEGFAMKWI